MKKITTSREILLLPKSNFFQRDWCELNNGDHSKKLSPKEQLIQICWNGLLREIIPEICETGEGNKPLTLWEINESGNLLDLRYGDFNQELNDEWSINPYVYLTYVVPN